MMTQPERKVLQATVNSSWLEKSNYTLHVKMEITNGKQLYAIAMLAEFCYVAIYISRKQVHIIFILLFSSTFERDMAMNQFLQCFFLPKLVRQRSPTLCFEPFRFWLRRLQNRGDIRIRNRLSGSLSRGVDKGCLQQQAHRIS
jgi:hypothetical protein